MSEKLYTTAEAAELLNISDENVRRWLRTGKITGIKLPNGAHRIRQSTLEGLLK